jgi:hypothetical protein
MSHSIAGSGLGGSLLKSTIEGGALLAATDISMGE